MIENANKNNDRDLMVAKIEIKKKELHIAKLEAELELKTKENLELNQFLDTLKWVRLEESLDSEIRNLPEMRIDMLDTRPDISLDIPLDTRQTYHQIAKCHAWWIRELHVI